MKGCAPWLGIARTRVAGEREALIVIADRAHRNWEGILLNFHYAKIWGMRQINVSAIIHN